jgi:hypothetical protein
MYAARSEDSRCERAVLSFYEFGADAIITAVNYVGVLTHCIFVVSLISILLCEIRETPPSSEF